MKHIKFTRAIGGYKPGQTIKTSDVYAGDMIRRKMAIEVEPPAPKAQSEQPSKPMPPSTTVLRESDLKRHPEA